MAFSEFLVVVLNLVTAISCNPEEMEKGLLWFPCGHSPFSFCTSDVLLGGFHSEEQITTFLKRFYYGTAVGYVSPISFLILAFCLQKDPKCRHKYSVPSDKIYLQGKEITHMWTMFRNKVGQEGECWWERGAFYCLICTPKKSDSPSCYGLLKG